MDTAAPLLIAVCVGAFVGTIWVGISLDRRTQQRQSERFMRSWMIRTRVLRELYDRWHGPLRLQDRRGDTSGRPSRRSKRSKEG